MLSFTSPKRWILPFLLTHLTQTQAIEHLSKEDEEILKNLSLSIHRNTETEPCGHTGSGLSVLTAFKVINESALLDDVDKYTFESMVTTALGVLLLQAGSCSWDDDDDDEVDMIPGLVSYCDMGKDKTPILPDHESLVPLLLPPGSTSLPCHFHTREGRRVTSFEILIEEIKKANTNKSNECSYDDLERQAICENLKEEEYELDLYAVAAGRVFMFAPSYIGEIFELPHVPTAVPLKLEVLSLSPRVFEIHGFFSKEEGDKVIEHILAETDENMRLKRSSTGATGYTVNPMRTSEGGFDTISPHAIELKTRCFKMLGFEEYNEVFADGLQILRYNQTGGYVDHEDFLDDNNPSEEHDYDSTGIGTNRFATVLMYFNDLVEDAGGETVFTQVWPPTQPESDHVELDTAIEQFRQTPYAAEIKEGSWEERLSAQCRTKFAIKPKAQRTILFYSQNADGSLDVLSKHGGCPVLNGTKWASNLWVWSGPMNGPFAPVNRENVVKNMKAGRPTSHPQAVQGVFRNGNNLPEYDEAELYYGEQRWGSLGKGSSDIYMNTFYGHKWDVKVRGEIVKSWTVAYGEHQVFEL